MVDLDLGETEKERIARENREKNHPVVVRWIKAHRDEFAYREGSLYFNQDENREKKHKSPLLIAELSSDGKILWLSLKGNKIGRDNIACPMPLQVAPGDFQKQLDENWKELKARLQKWIDNGIGNASISYGNDSSLRQNEKDQAW
jgi:hypothetical protein